MSERVNSLEVQKYIKDNFNNKTLKQMADELNLSQETVTKYARSVGLNKKTQRIEMLKQFVLRNYETMTIETMASTFKSSPRTIKEVLKSNGLKPVKLGRTSVSKEEKKEVESYIKSNYQTKTLVDIASDLDLDYRFVSHLSSSIGINKREIRIAKIEKFVLEHHDVMSEQEMADSLKSTKRYIKNVLDKHHLVAYKPKRVKSKRGRPKRVKSKRRLEIEGYLEDNYKSKTLETIAEELNMSVHVLKIVADNMGLEDIDT